MPRKAQLARLEKLRDIDIATQLAQPLKDVEAVLETSASDEGGYLLDTWEESLRPHHESLHERVLWGRGERGYRESVAAFARGQHGRARALLLYHVAVRNRSRRAMDRWVWAVDAYRADVERFTSTWLAVLENRSLLAASKAPQSLARRRASFRILDVALAQHRKSLVASELEDPFYRRHAIDRIAEGDRVAAERLARTSLLLTEREEWRQTAENAVGARIPKREIARLGSIGEQIAAYKRLIRESSNEERLKMVKGRLEAFRNEMELLRSAL